MLEDTADNYQPCSGKNLPSQHSQLTSLLTSCSLSRQELNQLYQGQPQLPLSGTETCNNWSISVGKADVSLPAFLFGLLLAVLHTSVITGKALLETDFR